MSKPRRIAPKLTRADAETLRNLASEYRHGSAHETLWDRLYDALEDALREPVSTKRKAAA